MDEKAVSPSAPGGKIRRRKPARCQNCQRDFYSAYNLRRHLRRCVSEDAKQNVRKEVLKEQPKERGSGAQCKSMEVDKTIIKPLQLFSITLWLDAKKGIYFCTLAPYK